MAITASKSINLYTKAYPSSVPYVLTVSFEETGTSTANNTSTISITGSIKSTGQAWDSNYDNYLKIYWYDNNSGKETLIKTSSAFQDLTKNTSKSVTGSTTVTHKSDGTLSGYAKVYFDAGSTFNYIPVDSSVSTATTTLTTIPRTSSFTLSASSCYAGNNITFNISRASSSFTHKLFYKIGSGSWIEITNGVATSYTWTVPVNLIITTGNQSTAITVSVDTYSGSTYIGYTTQSFTLTPYGASTISSTSGNTIGGAMTISISRNNANFTHTVVYYYGNASGTIATGVGTSATWSTIPMDLCSQTPNATSGTGTLYVYTYYGSTQIGSAQSKSFTINVPSSVVPTFSALNLTRVDNGVPSSWGVYVQGYSKVTASVSGASGSYGSTISSYCISGDGKTVNASSLTSGVLASSGKYSFSAYVKDSRGRQSGTKTNSITVCAYSKPSISLKAVRCNEDETVSSSGTYLKVTCSFSYASVEGKNTITRSVSCNGVSNTTFASGSTFRLDANCAITNTYTVTATIKDALGNTSTATYFIPTAERIMNVKPNGKGVAFGGFATEDAVLKSYWDLKVEANVYSATGTISKSDRNKKKDFTEFDERYESLFMGLKPQLYRFVDGTSGRLHSGFVSQDVEQSLENNGLTALDFAGFCKDESFEEERANGRIRLIRKLDENGEQIYDYALRYEEFIALNTYMIQRQQKIIETQQEQIDILQNQIDELKVLIGSKG